MPDSIRQPNPPGPDIECVIDGTGPLAVEMVALDAAGTRVRLNNMLSTEDAWNAALAQWPPSMQARLSTEYQDAFLGLQIKSEAGSRVRTHLLHTVQAKLLALEPAFSGDIYADNELPDALFGARVHRGPIKNGPRLIAPSSGSVQPMQIDKIREKLTVKTYQTKAPLELFAYSVHDEVDGYVGALEAIEQCVEDHLPGSLFRCVRVFDFGRGRHVGSWP